MRLVQKRHGINKEHLITEMMALGLDWALVQHLTWSSTPLLPTINAVALRDFSSLFFLFVFFFLIINLIQIPLDISLYFRASQTILQCKCSTYLLFAYD